MIESNYSDDIKKIENTFLEFAEVFSTKNKIKKEEAVKHHLRLYNAIMYVLDNFDGEVFKEAMDAILNIIYTNSLDDDSGFSSRNVFKFDEYMDIDKQEYDKYQMLLTIFTVTANTATRKKEEKNIMWTGLSDILGNETRFQKIISYYRNF